MSKILYTIQKKLGENFKNSIWYGGLIAIYTTDDYDFELHALGDIHVDLLEDEKESFESFKDKNNDGLFYSDLRIRVNGDSVLRKFLDEDKIVFHNNNWFEVFVIDKKTLEEESFVLDNDMYDDAIEELKKFAQENIWV